MPESTTTTNHGPSPIAVIGTGCRFPGGATSPSKLWSLLHTPRDLLQKIPTDRFNADAFYHRDGTHHGATNVQHSYFLDGDARTFDAGFFGIKPHEADCVDPQQRLLLETVYEGLCSAGLKIEDLQGSNTAVYVGLMCADYSDILLHDIDSAPTYTATGSSRCIISNRVSYFFDWHGPSMTIDTACSSSLVAVHQAVQSLRNGDCKVAVAAGANLIFGPNQYVVESKLSMLSPDGRSHMWDDRANGYARGEGIASVVLKTLEQALRDGDQIECIIRETGVNQDGRTPGITMPSHTAQENLIRETYAKAGLDARKASERCQYFEAHGTGTPAGDPQEAEAISSAFFGSRAKETKEENLFVGSIKTVIGHTEGTAGLAGLIKASLAVQHGIIPPNMLFENLSPKVAPFYKNLQILTKAKQWPQMLPGSIRRASVNSFGFGGTNAHAIIEQYEGGETKLNNQTQEVPSLLPLTISSSSEKTLRGALEGLLEYLKEHPDAIIEDVAFTLQSRRSVLQYRTAIPAQTIALACEGIEKEIELFLKNEGRFIKSDHKKRKPHLLGIFTGQGAQWPAMGKALLQGSQYVRDLVDELDLALATLPASHRPEWTLKEELVKEGKNSRVTQAEFSQPLCAAIQIVLVELLTAAGISFKAVVGHSSGEIGCAFASGCISASQAIRTAFYRGVYSKQAGSPSAAEGGMMAVGTTLEDARELCELEAFAGRLCVAACNAPDSVTMSGDLDAIAEMKEILDDESKFNRILKVDKAYHSHHMLPCARPYIQALTACHAYGSSKLEPTTIWFSSVHPGVRMTGAKTNPIYWKDNLVSPVMFSQALQTAVDECGPFDAVVEVGPHPALKGPSQSNLTAAGGSELPYSGCLERNRNDIDAFSAGLGFLWERFGTAAVDFQTFEALVSPSDSSRQLVKDLPSYSWDHSKSYWAESRLTKAFFHREEAAHPLLGTLDPNSNGQTFLWHNLLRPSEISWLDGHQLQGQTVLPGAAYAVMAMEAGKFIAGDRPFSLVEVLDLRIGKAITFDNDSDAIEINLTMDYISTPSENSSSIELKFSCDSCLAKESHLSWSAGGRLLLTFGPSSVLALPTPQEEPPHLTKVNIDKFYRELGVIGYGYTKDFRGLTEVRRATGQSFGNIRLASNDLYDRELIIHPATLDVAFQAFIGAFCAPGDERLWSLHVPVSIQRIAVNPQLSVSAQSSPEELTFSSTIGDSDSSGISGDVQLFNARNETVVQIEEISFKPFSAATASDDRLLFSEFVWGPLTPDTVIEDAAQLATAEEKVAVMVMERMVWYYVNVLVKNLKDDDKKMAAPHFINLFKWTEYLLKSGTNGTHQYYEPSWDFDSLENIVEIANPLLHRADIRMIHVVGNSLLAVIRDEANMIEEMSKDGLLEVFYEEALGFRPCYQHLGRLVSQISHRHPNLEVLEIGAGTGGATKHVLPALGNAFNGYTFTDISSGFFDAARTTFSTYEERMDFNTFDCAQSAEGQGFKEHSYDLIIASNVLHATSSLDETIKHCRELLKPGGHLVLLEITNRLHNWMGFIFGTLSGWWEGVDDGRTLEPFVSVAEWEKVLQNNNFSAVETCTSDLESHTLPLSVFSARAMSSKVEQLIKPLAFVDIYTARSDIIVIGGTKSVSARIIADLRAVIPTRDIQIFSDFSDLVDIALPAQSTFLVLSELDDELFANLNEDRFEGTKTMLMYAQNILWLTEDGYTEHPYQCMIAGLFRTLRLEYPDVQVQILDVENASTFSSKELATWLLRLEASYGLKPEETLWTSEYEVRIEGGIPLVPRLKPDGPRNDRYNALRRNIYTSALPGSVPLVLCKDDASYGFQIDNDKFLSSKPAPGNLRIRVQYSLPKAIRIGTKGFFNTVIGQVIGSNEHVYAFTTTNASMVEIPIEWTAPCTNINDPQSALVSFAGELVAFSVLGSASSGTSVIVHEPASFLQSPLARQASERRVTLRFTTSKPVATTDSLWINVHPRATQRSIVASLPSMLCSFFDMSNDCSPGSLARRLTSCLPAYCKTFTPEDFAQESASVLCETGELLMEDYLDFQSSASSSESWNADSIPILKIGTPEAHIVLNIDTVIDWSDQSSVVIKVRPVDAVNLFEDHKTYVLVGLTGDLGRSICRWMVKHGARYVVLCSRNPKIDDRWIEMMSLEGATIAVKSLNVSSKESICKVMDGIKSTMPPIAGIAHGPLVLQDAMFENMELETMEMVLEAKVKGGVLLDEYFSDNSLDFFVMFSSLVSVGGNRGQSNYSAANTFLTALAARRRKRGLAGSSINISAVEGVGFVAKAAREENYSVSKIMFLPLSEQDLQLQFAEAVVAGKPGSKSSWDITTGMPFNDPANREHIPFIDDPRLGFFKLPDRANKSGGDATGLGGPVKARLLEAKSHLEASQIINASLAAKLRSTLQVSAEETLDVDTPLIDQGVDSLVAVSLRGWFSKELDLDLPVLKVLGGASINNLVEDAMNRLPAAMMPLLSVKEEAAPTIIAEKTPEASNSPPPSSENGSDLLSSSSMTPEQTSMDELFDLNSGRTSDGKTTPVTSMSDASGDDYFKSAVLIQDSTELERIENLSYGQSRFWFLRQLVSDPTTFNVTIGLWIDGELNTEKLAKSCQVFVQRHETFRTRFFEEGGVAKQGIMLRSKVSLERITVKDKADATEGFEHLQKNLYDLESGNTSRMVLYTWDPTHSFLVICYHHIIMDGWSFESMVNELGIIYDGRPLAKAGQYADFAARQRSEFENGGMDNEIKYWEEEYKTLPPPLPLMSSLSLASTRSSSLGWDFYECSLRLPPMVAARIKDRSRKHKANPIHFYLAAFQVLLARLTGSDDICIGLADANRTGTDDLSTMGFFINLLPLRLAYDKSQTFGEAIGQARNKTRDAISNSRLPFDVLLQRLHVPRTSTHSPIFQAFLDYKQGQSESGQIGKAQVSGVEMSRGRTGYDVTLEITEDPTKDPLINLKLQRSFYDQDDVALLLKSYTNILSTFARNPALRVDEVRLHARGDLDQSTKIGQGPEFSLPSTSPTLVHKIEDFCKSIPGDLALEGDNSQSTYAQMGRRINSIANALAEQRIAPGIKVAVMQSPGPEWICSMLAIMKLGGVYVPLDSSWPLPRLTSVMANSSPAVVISDTSIANDRFDTFYTTRRINVETIATTDVSTLTKATPDMAAAIIYTSGTSGTPKGIVLSHQGLSNNIEGTIAQFQLGPQRSLQQNAYTFDLSLNTIFIPLATGGSVFVVPSHSRRDSLEICKLIASRYITYTKATPSEYASWTSVGSEKLKQAKSWTHAFTGGEVIPHSLIRAIRALDLEQLRFFCVYGPAEISLSSHKIEMNYKDELPTRIPAGLSLPNYSTYIVDEDLRPVPAGWSGEILIGGLGVSSGYLNDKDLTAVKFLPDTYATPEQQAKGWTHLMRTGDKGRLRADGVLYIDGRIDGNTQIKLRGFRIDLQDIENSIVSASGGSFDSAIVTVRGQGEAQYLVAHVVFSPSSEIADRDGFLRKSLGALAVPNYMRPNLMLALKSMPLTAHGKHDRRAVSALELPLTSESNEDGATLSAEEEAMWALWKEILPEEVTASARPTSDLDFVGVGGNSMLMVKLHALLVKKMGLNIPLADLFEVLTLGEMTAKCVFETGGDNIDWRMEAALDISGINEYVAEQQAKSIGATQQEKRNGIHILLTGATGFVGRHLLQRLVANEAVAKISCVSVRQRALYISSAKIDQFSGDLGLPQLGLENADFDKLSSMVDLIIHSGANRSFWDAYRLVKPTNVSSTHNLVRLAAARKLPIVFVSSGGVTAIDPEQLTLDGSKGYVTSKFVAENVLANAANQLGLPISIVRPMSANESGDFDVPASKTITKQAVLKSIIALDRVIGKRFEFDNFKGSISIMSRNGIVDSICESAFSDRKSGVKHVNYNNAISLNAQDYQEFIASGVEVDDEWRGLPTLSAIYWFGHSKLAEWEYMICSQEFGVGDRVSRR